MKKKKKKNQGNKEMSEWIFLEWVLQKGAWEVKIMVKEQIQQLILKDIENGFGQNHDNYDTLFQNQSYQFLTFLFGAK